jgi:hypothetical protein
MRYLERNDSLCPSSEFSGATREKRLSRTPFECCSLSRDLQGYLDLNSSVALSAAIFKVISISILVLFSQPRSSRLSRSPFECCSFSRDLQGYLDLHSSVVLSGSILTHFQIISFALCNNNPKLISPELWWLKTVALINMSIKSIVCPNPRISAHDTKGRGPRLDVCKYIDLRNYFIQMCTIPRWITDTFSAMWNSGLKR